ncbi:hypothetical protein AQUCO_03700278v1 [Aquilegia coerulea]|uniref:60S acidic ribosomal protein P1 n=1 Tax=Aquilegia coerulea TaxID=218851 RepID=A0A2G5CVH6_AQUCA|nr:hypothetical protein AQUCO_03700278v1 [Aquilegia coerulea]PIA34908.1 hypothetical protein AQUCO_03700278v1 [Aquilegia coerulea]
MSTVGELGCIYASLLLHDDGIEVTKENIATVVKAAKVEVDAYWPGIFAKLAKMGNLNDLMMNVGTGGGGGGAAVAVSASGGAAAPAAAAAPVAEEKKEEVEEESDEDIGIGLFGGDDDY